MQICRASKITWPDLLTYVVRKLKTISAPIENTNQKEECWVNVNVGCWEANALFCKNGPTNDEEYLHGNIADSRATSEVVVVADEAHVVRHRHGDVERGEQDQPVPAGFERAVVQQDEFGLLDICDLVLGQSGRVPEHVLNRKGTVSTSV